MEDTKLQMLRKFLVFSYFGMNSSEDIDTVLKYVVARAYRDASSRVISLSDNDKKEKLKLIVDAVKRYPDIPEEKKCTEIKSEEMNQFDLWHMTLCNSLTGTNITIGIAQKWVNMSVKYIYLLSSVLEIKTLKILEDQDKYHIPLDNYILRSLKDNPQFTNKIRLDGHGQFQCITGSGDSYKFKMSADMEPYSWSTIAEYSLYYELQKKIKREILVTEQSPLMWENETWINIAKTKSKNWFDVTE